MLLINVDRELADIVITKVKTKHGGYVLIRFNNSYLITELLDTDLRKVLEKEHPKLTKDHFKLFLY